jgi:hypothetical protein
MVVLLCAVVLCCAVGTYRHTFVCCGVVRWVLIETHLRDKDNLLLQTEV